MGRAAGAVSALALLAACSGLSASALRVAREGAAELVDPRNASSMLEWIQRKAKDVVDRRKKHPGLSRPHSNRTHRQEPKEQAAHRDEPPKERPTHHDEPRTLDDPRNDSSLFVFQRIPMDVYRIPPDNYFETDASEECGGESRLFEYPFGEDDGDGEIMNLLRTEPQQLDVVPRGHTDPVELEGRQWCEGQTSEVKSNKKVAVVLIGQSFRSRDFFHHKSMDCADRSVPVQRRIAENHLKRIVGPLEARGMEVDIFPTITPCSVEHVKGALVNASGVHFDQEATLVDMYGTHVKSVFRLNRTLDRYHRMAHSFNMLDEVMASGDTYEYFVFLRYDVVLDQDFSALIPPNISEHDGLSFFFRVHDFMFGFPGEFWNCMSHFWTSCMAFVRNRAEDEVSVEARKQLGCFDLGPVHMEKWYQGYAYDIMFRRLVEAVHWRGAWPLHPNYDYEHPEDAHFHEPWDKVGTSGFDSAGAEHRCLSRWFWPPRSSWEAGHMPYYFHVGPRRKK